MTLKKTLLVHLEKVIEESVNLAKESLDNKSLRFRYVPHVRETLQVEQRTFTQTSSSNRSITSKSEFHRDDFQKVLEKAKILPSYIEISRIIDTIKQKSSRSSSWIVVSIIRCAIRETLGSILDDTFEVLQSGLVDTLSGQLNEDELETRTNEAQRNLKSKLNDIKIRKSEYAMTAVKEILCQKRLYTVRMWMVGLHVLDNNIDGEGFLLRSTTQDDLTDIYPTGNPPIWYKQSDRIIPTSILEIEIEAINQPELSRKISRKMISLLLFRGSIDYWKYRAVPDSIECDYDLMINTLAKNTAGVKVTPDDLDEIAFHLNELPELIPKTILRGRYHQDTGLAIAYHKYEEAVKEKFTPQEIVNNCVIGLESIYLKLDYKKNKGSRLATAVSKILKNEGFNEPEVKKNVKNAYSKIRNKISHGTPLNKEARYLSQQLVGPLLEYLRKSIINLLKSGCYDFV